MYIYDMYIYIYIYMYVYIYICMYIYMYICFVATCRLWRAIGGVHALLVLEPTECSKRTKEGA